MKLYLLLLSFVIVLVSCSTSYKSGQTPDDVYYSPARQRDEYTRVEKKDDRSYQSEETTREDRYLRMKTQNRRYSSLDDCDCYCYSSFNYYRYNDYHRYNSYAGFNTTWYSNPKWGYYNPYYYNPYYANPYYNGYVAGNVQPIYNKPRTSNLNTYNNNTNSYNSNVPRKGSSSASSANDNYQGSGTNAGGFLRNTFGTSNSNSSGSSSNSSGSSSSSSSSSSGSSSSSSSAPVRKF